MTVLSGTVRARVLRADEVIEVISRTLFDNFAYILQYYFLIYNIRAIPILESLSLFESLSPASPTGALFLPKSGLRQFVKLTQKRPWTNLTLFAGIN